VLFSVLHLIYHQPVLSIKPCRDVPSLSVYIC